MQLDETVCRGSLIIHCGISYAVVSERPESYSKGMVSFRGWAILPTADIASGVIAERIHVSENEEVNMFFPGVAFAIPDYIK